MLPMIICDLCHKSNIKQIGIQGNPLRFEWARDSLIGHGVEFEFSAHGRHLGFSCVHLAYPERREGAVIMTNKASDQIGIFYEILLSIAAEYDWPMAQ